MIKMRVLDSQTLQHLDAVESVHMTLGVAVFNPLMVVARVIWIFDHVVLVKSVYRLKIITIVDSIMASDLQ